MHLGASRFGQSPLSCSFHFIRLALRSYFSISLRTLQRPLRWRAFDAQRIELTLNAATRQRGGALSSEPQSGSTVYPDEPWMQQHMSRNDRTTLPQTRITVRIH